MKIQSKLLSAFLALSIIPLLFVATIIFSNARNSLTQTITTSLEKIADNNIERLEEFADEGKIEIQSLQRDEIVLSLFPQLNQFHTNPHSEDYIQVQRKLSSQLLPSMELHGYQDIFLLNTDGKVIFGARETDPNSQIVPHLAKQFLEVFELGKKDFTISDVFLMDGSKDLFKLYALPLRDGDGNLLGVVMMQLRLTQLFNEFQDTTGLGQSGETVLGIFENSHFGVSVDEHLSSRPGDHVLILNPLKRNPLAALNLEIYGDSEGQLPIYLAATNHVGSGVSKDYSGTSVIAAWRYFPDFNWGLVTKVDTDEALLPIDRLQLISLIVGFLALFLVAIVSFALSTSISNPIRALTDAARHLGEGHFSPSSLAVLRRSSSSSSSSSSNEIQDLSFAFSEMAHKLFNSLEESKNIVQRMPYALLLLGPDGLIQMANHMSSKLIGVPNHQLVGHPSSRFIRFEHFDPSKLSDLIDKGVVTDLNAFIQAKGKMVPVVLSGVRLGTDSNVVRYAVVIKDIRELRKYAEKRVKEIIPVLNRVSLGDFSQKIEIPSFNDEFTDLLVSIDLMVSNLQELSEENRTKEAQIEASRKQLEVSHDVLLKSKNEIEAEKSKAEALLGSIGEGIIAIDLQGRIILMNHQAEQMFQKETRSVLGTPFVEHFNFEDQSGKPINMESEIFNNVVAKKIQHFTTTYFTQPNTERLPLATTLSPILLGKRLIGIIGTFRDITRETEIDKAKSEFVSLASHQLRTPLTAVKWLLEELTRKGGFNAVQRDHLNDIQASTSRLITLVNDLLNVSRLESGVLTIEPKPVELGKWLEDAVKEYRFAAKAKQQRIEFERPKTPIPLSVDPELYRQVLDNMVSNAIKYSFNGKTIFISLTKKSHGITLSVKDQGIGMTPNEKKSLFNKFFRTAEASKFSTTSSGLGLYIMKKILDISGGSVTVESEKGKGTVISVTYPMRGMKERKGAKGLV